jgi:hypothetical protein
MFCLTLLWIPTLKLARSPILHIEASLFKATFTESNRLQASSALVAHGLAAAVGCLTS